MVLHLCKARKACWELQFQQVALASRKMEYEPMNGCGWGAGAYSSPTSGQLWITYVCVFHRLMYLTCQDYTLLNWCANYIVTLASE